MNNKTITMSLNDYLMYADKLLILSHTIAKLSYLVKKQAKELQAYKQIDKELAKTVAGND
ncbi:hypothetical protein LCGC14_2782940 [marine sediment metagenome]|uniref:Uncharacterized protein n=1 Tax=marine sediment metagenome TaxID=412755 RepID=A0A0F9BJB8_9ZZZZ